MDYEGAYRTLATAVITSMTREERAEKNYVRGMCTETGVMKLRDYLHSVRRDAPTTLDGDAIAQHALMASYERAGFTRDEAMVLLLAALENAAKTHVAIEMLKRHDDD